MKMSHVCAPVSTGVCVCVEYISHADKKQIMHEANDIWYQEEEEQWRTN